MLVEVRVDPPDALVLTESVPDPVMEELKEVEREELDVGEGRLLADSDVDVEPVFDGLELLEAQPVADSDDEKKGDVEGDLDATVDSVGSLEKEEDPEKELLDEVEGLKEEEPDGTDVVEAIEELE